MGLLLGERGLRRAERGLVLGLDCGLGVELGGWRGLFLSLIWCRAHCSHLDVAQEEGRGKGREMARERESTEVLGARGAYICLTWKDEEGAKSVRNHCSRRAGFRVCRIYIVSHRNQDKMRPKQNILV